MNGKGTSQLINKIGSPSVSFIQASKEHAVLY